MKRILAALFAFVCVASASAAPFQNGGFELGTLTANPCNVALPIGSTAITGWTVVLGNIEYLTPSCWTPAEGSRSLDLVGNGSIGGIQQTFDTVFGQTYQVIFNMAGNPSTLFPPAVKKLSVFIDGIPQGNYTFDTTFVAAQPIPTANLEWITYSFLFIATSSSTTISFVSDMTPSTFAGAALDNVRVQAVAGPNVAAWGDTTLAGNVHSGQSTTFPTAPQVCGGTGSTWNSINTLSYPLTVTSNGIQGTVVVSYNVPQGNSASGICGSWTTRATATFNGDVTVLWDYRGDHSSFNTTVDLQAFVVPGPLGTAQSNYIVSGANNGTKFQFSGQYTFHVMTGDIYGFTMTGSNFDFADALTGTFTAVVSEPSGAPAALATPVLLRALPTGSAVVPLLIGRVDGAANTPITVRLYSGTTCTNGVLGGTVAPLGTDASVTTDPKGYFGTPQGGAQGQFVAVGVVSPQVTPLSACAVTAADNDTWPKALTLSGASVTVPDWIDTAGKARWYKFSVLPGQSIQVTMSSLPADYDLAVFKDIGAAFQSELAPANTTQLTKLSAEFAPSTFSPSTFSPSTFSPSTFSPSTFSPSAFSPSTFSPSTFSPSTFSPSTFSPSTFSPSTFSPSTFSPSTFSPSTFSPSTFSPSTFSPSTFSDDELARAFSSAQTRSIIAASMTPGTSNESVLVNSFNNFGDFYVRVTGRGGAFSATPYSLAVTKQGTSCAGVSDTAITSRAPINGSYNTIVLLDSSKTSLTAALPGGGTLGAKLNAFVQRPDVNGVIVDILADGRISTLKTQASNNVTCPFAKNLVALEIKSIVDAYLSANPLRYVVIVGNDDAIPFFRYPDQGLLGPESDYVPPVNSNSASEASLRGNFVLSQDAYGAIAQISLRVSDFPVLGLAVGRLVETPAEIAGMIDAYVAANGSISPSSSLVTGYDFLQDDADAVRVELEAGTGHASDALITLNTVSPADTRTYVNGGPWTATDLRQKLLTTRHDVMFLAGHFNANSALAADFKTSMVTSELAAGNFMNTLVFSAGCHAGYNLVDTDAINGVTFPLDWAQAFAQQKTTLVAGTGYQYGDTDFLEYSERLYLNFAKELRAGNSGDKIAIGEALVRAKLAYLAATPEVRGLHEKAVLEATLFGLPMLGVNMPAGRTGVSTNSGVINATLVPGPSPANTLGLQLADLSVLPTLTPHTLSLTNYDLPLPNSTIATWLSGPDGVATNPAEPTRPLQVVNVTPTDPTLVLRGVGFRGGTYSDSTVVPLSGAPTTELRGVHTPFSSPVFFPMRLWTTNYFSALSTAGGATKLLVTPAQHQALNLAMGTSTLRQYPSLDLRLYYSSLTTQSNPAFAEAALSDAPTIVHVDGSTSGAFATFSAQVVGDPVAAIHEVWVTYTNGVGGTSTWISVNLQQCVDPLPAACGTTSDSRFWMAQVPTATLPADTKYIVQAANGVGLVSLDDNLGSYYSVGGAAAPAATTMVFSGSLPTNVGFGDTPSITAALSAGGSPLAGKLVTIAAGGGARSGTTDAGGSVTLQVPMLSAPGAYPLTASFGGDAAFLPSSVTAPLAVTVSKAATTLAPPPSGLGAVLTASVGGAPLIQQSIQFLISGPGGVQQVFAITDYTGRATIPPPGFPSGTYSVIQACFGGNATYSGTKLNPNPACGYQFAGFFAPISNLPAVNNANSGQAIPVKFSLGGNRGLSIFASGSPASQAVSCSSLAGSATVTLDPTTTAGNSSLQYDAASDQYTYVWKTDKAWAKTCRVLVLTLNDGSQYRANFNFTK